MVIVSASLGAYLRPLAEHLELDAALAVELVAGADGLLTGEVVGGLNTRGPEKVARLRPGPTSAWARRRSSSCGPTATRRATPTCWPRPTIPPGSAAGPPPRRLHWPRRRRRADPSRGYPVRLGCGHGEPSRTTQGGRRLMARATGTPPSAAAQHDAGHRGEGTGVAPEPAAASVDRRAVAVPGDSRPRSRRWPRPPPRRAPARPRAPRPVERGERRAGARRRNRRWTSRLGTSRRGPARRASRRGQPWAAPPVPPLEPPPAAPPPPPPLPPPGAVTTIVVRRKSGCRSGVRQAPDTVCRPGRSGRGTVTVARATPSAPTVGAATSSRSMPSRAVVRGRHVCSATVMAWPGAGVASSTVIVFRGGG